MKISLIGGGNLGAALARGVLASGTVQASDLTIYEKWAAARQVLADSFQCSVLKERTLEMPTCEDDIVIFAVKPQDAESACREWVGGLSPRVVVLSVMAGVSVERLVSILAGHQNVARAMPNLGAQVRESATVFYCAPSLNAKEIELVSTIAQSWGRSWQVFSEDLINAATAVAGSGPAYFCWLGEQMAAVATALGFDAIQANELVIQTLRGTAAYLSESALAPSEVRRQVTSPNGTTAAAIEVLGEKKAEHAVTEAVHAAYKRARELSEG